MGSQSAHSNCSVNVCSNSWRSTGSLLTPGEQLCAPWSLDVDSVLEGAEMSRGRRGGRGWPGNAAAVSGKQISWAMAGVTQMETKKPSIFGQRAQRGPDPQPALAGGLPTPSLLSASL